ncbi:MAG: hypothetical protein OXI15_02340 [Chromatiales bacterium]|nr:hypothetical protein [Chromatiales bacterium]
MRSTTNADPSGPPTAHFSLDARVAYCTHRLGSVATGIQVGLVTYDVSVFVGLRQACSHCLNAMVADGVLEPAPGAPSPTAAGGA